MSSFTDQAIILKRYNLGESDRILTLLTKYHGKFDAVAKGIRKIISRKGGNLDLLNLVEVKVVEGKSLAIITEASAISSFEHLKSDLQKIGHAYYVCELINNLIPDEKRASEVFALTLTSLNFLNQQRIDTPVEEYMKDFEIKLLKLAGFWSDKMFGEKQPRSLKEWRQFNQIFIEQILGKKLKSPPFLRKI
ncbi:DNA repair protein RecO [Patescibacteria group bacterium]|nr:DNA repair protein RecO [Patescibacteria group bacterium]